MTPVIIKKYSNRKLYIPKGNTEPVGYIELPRILEIIRSGKSVTVIDNKTGEDLTERTLKAAIEYLPMSVEELERLVRGN